MDTAPAGAAIAVLIGLLLGLERERSRKPDEALFAGIRTFPLFTIAGYIGGFAGVHGYPMVLPVVLLLVGALTLTSYHKSPEPGATTEATALLAPLLGALVAWDQAPLAAGVAVVVTLLLTLKAPLHRVAGAVSEQEILAILKFAVVAVIVVPLLPARAMGPYGAIEPRRIGIIVLLLSGVSLLGYLLVRIVGGRAGWSLAGLLGGLVSSTAVTMSFSSKAREGGELVRALAVGILLASTILYLRGAVVLTLLDAGLGWHLAPRLAVLLAVGVAAAAVQWRGVRSAPADPAKLGNPVELLRAMLMAAMFVALLLAARVAQERLGTAGLWAVGALGGLVDVDSVAVAAARLRQQGLVDLPTAAGTYLLATLSNLLFKAGAVMALGGRELARRVLPGFGALGLATAVLLLVWR